MSWALVTAAALHQVNLTPTWSRGIQRVVGNLIGVLAFAAVLPLARIHPVALVLCTLALLFGAEALIGRAYWPGSVCAIPMAVLITEFARSQDLGRLITDRVADTLVGVLAGFDAAVTVTNRRVFQRLEHALTRRNASARTPSCCSLRPTPHPRPWSRPDEPSPPHSSICAGRPTRSAASGGSQPCPRSGSRSSSRPDTVRSRRRYDGEATCRTHATPAGRRRAHGHDGEER
ncbi:FUSC family protein [Streptomyces sp. MUSC 125]|uniref:FUSC family protein n=1 Tax=Streptomyces sp. MUSC 125 TaxID=1428624 RepID=UPI000B122481